jgi:hypothetical protein
MLLVREKECKIAPPTLVAGEIAVFFGRLLLDVGQRKNEEMVCRCAPSPLFFSLSRNDPTCCMLLLLFFALF